MSDYDKHGIMINPLNKMGAEEIGKLIEDIIHGKMTVERIPRWPDGIPVTATFLVRTLVCRAWMGERAEKAA